MKKIVLLYFTVAKIVSTARQTCIAPVLKFEYSLFSCCTIAISAVVIQKVSTNCNSTRHNSTSSPPLINFMNCSWKLIVEKAAPTRLRARSQWAFPRFNIWSKKKISMREKVFKPSFNCCCRFIHFDEIENRCFGHMWPQPQGLPIQ